MPAPTIETPRLLLRPWRDGDIVEWLRMNAAPRVREFFARPYDSDEDERMSHELRRRLERDGYGWWVLEVKGGPAFAGVIVLQEVPFEAPFTPAFEIGWRLVPDVWGNGYATEGATAALEFAFERLGHQEVVAMTAASNERSRRVMDRLGMTHNPADDFDHPKLEESHPLGRHVLYRLARHDHRRTLPGPIKRFWKSAESGSNILV